MWNAFDSQHLFRNLFHQFTDVISISFQAFKNDGRFFLIFMYFYKLPEKDHYEANSLALAMVFGFIFRGKTT